MLQTWEEHSANHQALLRELDRESGLTPTSEAHRWRRWFWGSFAVNLVLAIALMAATAHAQTPALPSPDVILRIQERNARERQAAIALEQDAACRLTITAGPQPAARVLSEAEKTQIREALERLYREQPGVVIDARTGQPVVHVTGQ